MKSQAPARWESIVDQPPMMEALEPRLLLSAGDGLSGMYFDNTSFSQSPIVERVDRAVAFNWGSQAPVAGVGADHFAVRWTGSVRPNFSETYTFHIEEDGGAGGVKLWLDDNLLIDTTATSNGVAQAQVALDASNRYKLRLDYSDTTGSANVKLMWSSAHQTLEVIPYNNLFTDYNTERVYGGNEVVDVTYYVSKTGSDSNNGLSLNNAFLTLNRAWLAAKSRNEANQSVKIYVNDGVYRETVQMWGNAAETAKPVIWEAINKDKAIVSGSDVFAGGWTQSNPTSNVWTHSWTQDWGYATVPNNFPYSFNTDTQKLVLRRELFFVDGRRLDPVASVGALTDNTFYVDETNNLVYIDFGTGESPTSNTVEAAMRPQTFYVERRENITVRGLRFQHAANSVFTVDGAPNPGYHTSALDFNVVDNITVQDVNIVNNSATGLSFYGGTDGPSHGIDNIVVEDVVVNFNGKSGANVFNIFQLDMDNVETSYNNWRGVIGGFIGWSVAGQKHLHIHNATYDDLRAIGNQTRGFWWDTDIINGVMDSAVFADNLTNGIFVEAVQGPVTIQNSTMTGNGENAILIASTGTSTTGLTLLNNVFRDNVGPQVRVVGSARTSHNFITGANYTSANQNLTLRRNDITIGTVGTFLIEAPHVSQFINSLDADDNLYYHATSANAFRAGTNRSLSNWQSLTGEDGYSRWVDPQYLHASAGHYLRDPVVYVAAEDAVASETGPNPASFRLRRVGVPHGDVVTPVVSVGSAVEYIDFLASTDTLSIADGDTVSELLIATPIDDNLAEIDETITYQAVEGAGYRVLGGETSFSAILTDNDGSSVNVQINFQPAAAPVPAGYLPDDGAVYGNRGNGYSYGWNVDSAIDTRDRNSSLAPDQRYDTFNTMSPWGNAANHTWQIAMPDGTYSVFVSVGDPLAYTGRTYSLNVEGVELVHGTPTSDDRFVTGAGAVTVTDGFLTVTNGPNLVGGNLINFIDIGTQLGESVSLIALTDTVAEGSDAVGAFRIARSGTDNSSPLTVNLLVGGTATAGDDYTALPASVVIPAGAAYVDVTFNVIDDGDHESTESVVVGIGNSANYQIDADLAIAAISITDNDDPPAYILGDFNLSGQLTNADIQAMLDALVDLNGYKTTHGLSDADLLAIGDINDSGSVTNADIQALLDLLTGQSQAQSQDIQIEPTTELDTTVTTTAAVVTPAVEPMTATAVQTPEPDAMEAATNTIEATADTSHAAASTDQHETVATADVTVPIEPASVMDHDRATTAGERIHYDRMRAYYLATTWSRPTRSILGAMLNQPSEADQARPLEPHARRSIWMPLLRWRR